MNTRMSIMFFAWFLINASTLGFAQVSESEFKSDVSAPTIRTSVHPETVQVAEAFVLMIEVEVDADTMVVFDEPPKSIGPLSVWDVQDEMALPATDSPKRRLFIRRMTLDSLKSGDMEVPSIPIAISSSSRSMTMSSQPVSVKVVSELSQDADQADSLRDILPPVPLDSEVWTILLSPANLLIASLVIVAIAVAGVAFRSVRSSPIKIDNVAIAKARLKKLGSSVDANSKPDEVFQGIEDTIKKLIELETPVAATKLSSKELLNELEEHNPISKYLQPLRQILNASERVRFAKVEVQPIELQNVTKDAVQWIETFENGQQKERS